MKHIDTNESLSKFLAQAGIASRRKVVDIIKSGVVTVNGVVVKEPGFKVVKTDIIKVNGQKVKGESKIYILLNKPKDYITTVSDDLGRRNVMELIGGDIKQRIYPIGRLDRNTTGLLVLTNDGDVALRLSHPRYEVEKIYHVTLDKLLHRKDVRSLLNGVTLEDGVSYVDKLIFLEGKSKKECIVIIHNGKNRIIRRLFEALGYEVVKLDRIGYAGLTKTGLAIGTWRHLKQDEIALLKGQ